MLQVRARCIVDVEKDPIGPSLTVFRVEVWGNSPFDYVRIYRISAKDDNTAAFEGLRRFEEEMEAMFANKG